MTKLAEDVDDVDDVAKRRSSAWVDCDASVRLYGCTVSKVRNGGACDRIGKRERRTFSGSQILVPLHPPRIP